MCIRAETTSVTIWELGDSILFLGDHAAGILHGLSNVQNKPQVCVGRSGVGGGGSICWGGISEWNPQLKSICEMYLLGLSAADGSPFFNLQFHAEGWQ